MAIDLPRAGVWSGLDHLAFDDALGFVRRVEDAGFGTVRRTAIVGDIESHRARIRDLRAAGADQINLYLERGLEAETIDLYAREILPAMSLT